MNRQALAFLTMFSLVLMLSIYYVTLPEDSSKTVMKNEPNPSSDSKVNKNKKTTSNSSALTQLQNSINQKKEVEINKQNDIIAATKAEEKEKQNAFTLIDSIKAQQKLQQTLVDSLKKEGYKTAVEINDTTCIVTVFEVKKDDKIAEKILLKASTLTNQKYLIEVTFK